MVSFLASLFFFGAQQALEFPVQPLPDALRQGREMWAAGHGIERTDGPSRRVIGSYFNGRIKAAADVVVWCSPKWLSVRLGYLQAKNRWTDDQLASVWNESRQKLEGRVGFAVRLCALRSRTGLDGELGDPADPREALKPRFILTSGPGLPERTPEWKALPWSRLWALPYRSTPGPNPPFQTPAFAPPPLWWAEDREPNALLRVDPLAFTPVAPWLGPDKPAQNPLPRGGNYVAVYWVEFDAATLNLHPEGFDLRILTPRKERVASYRFKVGLQ